jgi:hypothetical protein
MTRPPSWEALSWLAQTRGMRLVVKVLDAAVRARACVQKIVLPLRRKRRRARGNSASAARDSQ